MSIRFQKFVRRVAENSEFKAFKNLLLHSLEEEARNKYVQYPAFQAELKGFWEKISNKGELAKLLLNNYETIYRTWLTKIFPYRNNALAMSEPAAPTAVDFKLNFVYICSREEMGAMEAAKKAKNLEDDIQSIARRLFFFIVSAMGHLIALTVERPFSFQLATMNGEEKEGGYEIKTIISGREQ
ncbi:MAG: hypothetical protein RBG13Loki_2283 [Promethearchaeota archaeon CR_4]|nr:MAG: hypothetical protein RBG13Loki_2283 [Candidatus Lokiarchaeota archaeon CR_4]